MDAAQWPQEMGLVKPMEGLYPRPPMERRTRPQKIQALNCPRCNSTNTKFCYYNNYSLTQPRYFCKTCRRYWTEGGSLRNVPVGGCSRKNKRAASSSSSKTKIPDLNPPISPPPNSQNPKIIHEGKGLNLTYQTTQGYQSNGTGLAGLPSIDTNNNINSSSLDLLRASRNMTSFAPIVTPEAHSVYPSGYTMQEWRPTMFSFPVDGLGISGSYGNTQDQVQECASGRIMLSFEDLKPVSNKDFEQDTRQGESSWHWNGTWGGDSW